MNILLELDFSQFHEFHLDQLLLNYGLNHGKEYENIRNYVTKKIQSNITTKIIQKQKLILLLQEHVLILHLLNILIIKIIQICLY